MGHAESSRAGRQTRTSRNARTPPGCRRRDHMFPDPSHRDQTFPDPSHQDRERRHRASPYRLRPNRPDRRWPGSADSPVGAHRTAAGPGRWVWPEAGPATRPTAARPDAGPVGRTRAGSRVTRRRLAGPSRTARAAERRRAHRAWHPGRGPADHRTSDRPGAGRSNWRHARTATRTRADRPGQTVTETLAGHLGHAVTLMKAGRFGHMGNRMRAGPGHTVIRTRADRPGHGQTRMRNALRGHGGTRMPAGHPGGRRGTRMRGARPG